MRSVPLFVVLMAILTLAAAPSANARQQEVSWDELYRLASEQIPPQIVLELDDRAADALRTNGTVPKVVASAFPDAVLEPAFMQPAQAENRRLWRANGLHRWAHLQLHEPRSADLVSEALSGSSEILSVEASTLFLSLLDPQDMTGYDMWGVNQMEVPDAWDLQIGNDEIVVSTLDTGVDLFHPDITGNLRINPGEDLNGNGAWDASDNNGIDDDGNGYVDDLAGWDFVNQTPPGFMQVNGEDYAPRDRAIFPDIVGHGTHVAGTSGSVTNNGYGVPSPSWNVSNMPIRFGYAIRILFLVLGSGNDLDMANAIQYAVDNGSDIISISFGGTSESAYVAQAVAYAHQNDVLVFAAAGNSDNDTPNYPAATEHVISVAATGQGDVRASFSSYGTTVDIAAPGVGIWSTVPLAQGAYEAYDGTSMACPNTAGVAALVWSVNPDLSAAQVEQFMLDGSDNIDGINPGYEGLLGEGRVNAFNSVTLARATAPAPEFANLDIIPIGQGSVPAGGGPLAYNVTLSNQTGSALTGFSAWSTVILPNGNTVAGPLSMDGLSVGMDQTLQTPLQMGIPAFAPSGAYQFRIQLGWDDVAEETGSFQFRKAAD